MQVASGDPTDVRFYRRLFSRPDLEAARHDVVTLERLIAAVSMYG